VACHGNTTTEAQTGARFDPGGHLSTRVGYKRGCQQSSVNYFAELSWRPAGKGHRAMKIPKPHRGVAYSVADNRNGTWRWKLHPKLVPYTSTPLISGEVPGTQSDAITAAEAAIDKFLEN
jgi:hypothetical protein